MELANLWRGAEETAVIRTATAEDATDIYQLLRRAAHSHLHVGWHLPSHWLGRNEFLVYEPRTRGSSVMNKLWGQDVSLRACLVATANPAPVAWVHVAAIRGVAEPVAVLSEMMARIEEMFRQTAVTQIAWMSVDDWPKEWLEELGFQEINQLHTYFKSNMTLPELRSVTGLTIRPVTLGDIAELVEIEAEAFEPVWRHSADDLKSAFPQAFSFDVAELDDKIVGFQLSTADEATAHLARLTIAPSVQKQGVGSALLAHAIHGYQRQRLRSASLNTQADNLASQRLYKRFGFIATKQCYSIWVKYLR